MLTHAHTRGSKGKTLTRVGKLFPSDWGKMRPACQAGKRRDKESAEGVLRKSNELLIETPDYTSIKYNRVQESLVRGKQRWLAARAP